MCGQVGVSLTTLIIHSGAMISVTRQDVMDGRVPNVSHQLAVQAVGANGLPIDIVGQVDVLVSFKGGFSTLHTFVVVAELLEECLLGSDFLINHAPIIDYTEQLLLLGKSILA